MKFQFPSLSAAAAFVRKHDGWDSDWLEGISVDANGCGTAVLTTLPGFEYPEMPSNVVRIVEADNYENIIGPNWQELLRRYVGTNTISKLGDIRMEILRCRYNQTRNIRRGITRVFAISGLKVTDDGDETKVHLRIGVEVPTAWRSLSEIDQDDRVFDFVDSLMTGWGVTGYSSGVAGKFTDDLPNVVFCPFEGSREIIDLEAYAKEQIAVHDNVRMLSAM